MSLKDAEESVAKILRQVMEEKLSATNIEMAKVTEDGYHLYTVDEIQAILSSLPAATLE